MSTARCSRGCWRHDEPMTEELFREDATLLECAAPCRRSTRPACSSTAPCSTRSAAARRATPACCAWPTAAAAGGDDTRKHKERAGEMPHLLAAREPTAALQPGSRSRRASTPRAGRAHALPHRDAPAVRAGAAPGGRLLDHRRLRAARFPHDRAARQGGAQRGHRAPGGRGAPGAPPLDQRGRGRSIRPLSSKTHCASHKSPLAPGRAGTRRPSVVPSSDSYVSRGVLGPFSSRAP